MELISDRPESPNTAFGTTNRLPNPKGKEFTMHLPRLLSRLEDWITCGAGTGFTTDSGTTMEDSGAVEIRRGWDWQGSLP